MRPDIDRKTMDRSMDDIEEILLLIGEQKKLTSVAKTIGYRQKGRGKL